MRHGVELEHIDYIQIHPTTLYSKKPGRRFLISESVRGEGAKLYNAKGERFANEVLPRDVLTAKIREQMEKDGKPFVWLDMTVLGEKVILNHFPHIYERCLEEGYDVTKDWIPVVPAQHYFMGGIHVDRDSKTTMDPPLCGGRDQLQWRPRRQPSGQQFFTGESGIRRKSSFFYRGTLERANRSAEEFSKLLQKTEACVCQQEKDLADTYKQEVLGEIERERQAK